MNTSLRITAAVLLAAGAAAASAHGGRGGWGWGLGLNFGYPVYSYPGYGYPAYGTVYSALPAGAVTVTIGGGHYWRHGGIWLQSSGPAWVVVPPPVLAQAPAEAPPVSVPPTRPDPVIYPRNGQDANQTEHDRQECNRWAVTQPQAVADAAQFQRAIEACMDGRGYTMK